MLAHNQFLELPGTNGWPVTLTDYYQEVLKYTHSIQQRNGAKLSMGLTTLQLMIMKWLSTVVIVLIKAKLIWGSFQIQKYIIIRFPKISFQIQDQSN